MQRVPEGQLEAPHVDLQGVAGQVVRIQPLPYITTRRILKKRQQQTAGTVKGHLQLL